MRVTLALFCAITITSMVLAQEPKAQPTVATPAATKLTTPTAKGTTEPKISNEEVATAVGIGIAAWVAIAVVSLLFEMIPTMIAFARGHNNAIPIALVCLFFSWTCIGWIVALIWSFSDNTKKSRSNGRSRNTSDSDFNFE
jgi:CBS domain containing-hemolysin-like protein